MTHAERLEQSLRACDAYGNDHDYICKCRPVDVRAVLIELEQLRAAIDDVLIEPPSRPCYTKQVRFVKGERQGPRIVDEPMD